MSKTMLGLNMLAEKVREVNKKYIGEKLTPPIREEIMKELNNAMEVCLGSAKAKEFYVKEEFGIFRVKPKLDLEAGSFHVEAESLKSKYEIEIKDGDHAIRIANAMIRFGSELTDSIAFNSKNSVLLISRGSGKTAAMRVAAFVPAAVEGAKALLELVELKTGAHGEYPRGMDHGNIFSLEAFLKKAVPNLVQVGMKVPE